MTRDEHLANDLCGAQIANQTHAAGFAEGAPHLAAHLARHAERVPSTAHRDGDTLEFQTVMSSQHGFRCRAELALFFNNVRDAQKVEVEVLTPGVDGIFAEVEPFGLKTTTLHDLGVDLTSTTMPAIEFLSSKRAELMKRQTVDRKHPDTMSATQDQSQPRVDQSIGAWRLLRKRPAHAVVTALVILLSIPLSAVLVGILMFMSTVHFLVKGHFEAAFGVKSRGSFLSPFLILGLALGAIFICGSWGGLVDLALRGHGFGQSERFTAALMTLPIPYAISAWVLTPVAYLLVLLVDLDAPKSLRHLIPLALRVASEVPILHRIAAVLLSGAILVGPVVLSAYVIDHAYSTAGAGVLAGVLMIPLFIPVATALLVSSYSRVRHDLNSYQGHLPNFPTGLLLLTLVTFGASAVAAATGLHQPLSMLLLALAWFAIVAALFSFLSAHRIRCLDPMREGAAPGKRALEGVLLRNGKNVFVAGNLRFPIPSHALGDHTKSGEPMTLIGNFAATTQALFRDRAEQDWPKGGTLHASSLDTLIRGRVRFATWVSYSALAAAGVLAIEMLTNVF